MEIKTFSKVDEKIYYEKLDNGLEVYLYPTNKTKNFYITISVKYGANVTKYKNEKETIEVIPGSAHFLEHKVMALSENEEISKRINDLGSLANAWTSYYGTNYNIFGSINLRENLKLLLDIFYNTNINENENISKKDRIGNWSPKTVYINGKEESPELVWGSGIQSHCVPDKDRARRDGICLSAG